MANDSVARGIAIAALNNGSGGTSDYSELSNKPKINGVELSGNKTAADLGITEYTLPTATTSTLGGVKVDGSSITIDNGVISASGGSSVSVDGTSIIDDNGTLKTGVGGGIEVGYEPLINITSTIYYNRRYDIGFTYAYNDVFQPFDCVVGESYSVKIIGENSSSEEVTYEETIVCDNNGRLTSNNYIIFPNQGMIRSYLPTLHQVIVKSTTQSSYITPINTQAVPIDTYSLRIKDNKISLANPIKSIQDVQNYQYGTKIASPASTVSNNYAVVIAGNSDTRATGEYSTAIGYNAQADGYAAIAIGNNARAAGSEIALGNKFKILSGGNVSVNGNITATNLPTAPTTDGEYDLHTSVASGVPTYSWETAGGGASYTAGDNISIDSNGVISANFNPLIFSMLTISTNPNFPLVVKLDSNSSWDDFVENIKAGKVVYISSSTSYTFNSEYQLSADILGISQLYAMNVKDISIPMMSSNVASYPATGTQVYYSTYYYFDGAFLWSWARPEDLGNFIKVRYRNNMNTSLGYALQQITTSIDTKFTTPTPPTTDGTYTLQVVVADGTPTYSWVAQS